MVNLSARQLLEKLSKNYRQEKETFSKQEILQKINEIKYLSELPNISRLTIKKQLVHLESKMKDLSELERQLKQKKKEETAQVTALKKQVILLKKRLASSEDKDLQRKVDKLTYLLGEILAKKKVKTEVALSQKIVKENRKAEGQPDKNRIEAPLPAPVLVKEEKSEIPAKTISTQYLQLRLESMKQELELNKALERNPEKIKLVEEKINVLEKKLKKFLSESISAAGSFPAPEIETETSEKLPIFAPGLKSRHDLLFGKVSSKEKAGAASAQNPEEREEEELPLPPPPKRKQ